jgi:hypothetical protein
VSGICAMAVVRLEPFGVEIETGDDESHSSFALGEDDEDAGFGLLCCAGVVSPGATVRLHDDCEGPRP